MQNQKKLVKIATISIVVVLLAGSAWFIMNMQKNNTDKQKLNKANSQNAEANSLLRDANIQDLSAYSDSTPVPSTPEEKFAGAEVIAISNGEHDNFAEDLGEIIKSVFGEYKITGYTKGYMGMNSGSGVAQYTLKNTLSPNLADKLKAVLEQNGYSAVNSNESEGSASIKAEKDGYSYSLSYNLGEQEITAIIEKKANI